jgi:predicted enzyme related to lactoylglutathione lyase
MSHRSHLCTIVIDVPADQHEAASAFWGAATGVEQRQLTFAEFHGARLHPSLALLVQRLGSGEPRVHVDIHTDDVPAEIARLEALGASVVEAHDDWTVMADPSGLPFCVVKAPEGTLEDRPDVRTWG